MDIVVLLIWSDTSKTKNIKLMIHSLANFTYEKIILFRSVFQITRIWAAPCENEFSGIFGQRRPRSDCAFAQSDQDLHCPLTECKNGKQKPRWYYAHSQNDLKMRILGMFDCTFSLGSAYMIYRTAKHTYMLKRICFQLKKVMFSLVKGNDTYW